MQQTTDTITFELGTVTPDQALLYTQQFITTSGYTDPDSIDKNHDSIIAMGLGLLEDCPPWARGDHILAIRKRLGRGLTKAEMTQLAKLYKVSKSRLYNNATTADNWPQERRWATENVGYSHHEALNALEPDQQDEIIERADAEAWSVDQLATQLHYAGTEPVAPSVTPDSGNPPRSIYSGIPDEPLSRNSIQYQSGGPVRDDDYEQQSEAYAEDGDGYDWTPELPPPADLARQIKAQYSAGDIATLVAELVAIPY